MIEIIRPLLIAGLVVTEVGLWQWRMVIATRGNRASAMLLGAIGAVVQITAISQVVTNLSDPLSAGVLLGSSPVTASPPGMVGATIITAVPDVARGLWARGWPATVQAGHGENRPVTVLFVAVNRRRETSLHRDVAQLAPEAFWSTEDLRARGGAGDGMTTSAAGRHPPHRSGSPADSGSMVSPRAGGRGAETCATARR